MQYSANKTYFILLIFSTPLPLQYILRILTTNTFLFIFRYFKFLITWWLWYKYEYKKK